MLVLVSRKETGDCYSGGGEYLRSELAPIRFTDPKGLAVREFTQVLARAYDYGMGVVLFAPMAILAWLPIISAFQMRFLFNEAFNRRLQIQPILAGKKKE
ncbi:hypothetical protein YC2023_053170 [Brassica napus]